MFCENENRILPVGKNDCARMSLWVLLLLLSYSNINTACVLQMRVCVHQQSLILKLSD